MQMKLVLSGGVFFFCSSGGPRWGLWSVQLAANRPMTHWLCSLLMFGWEVSTSQYQGSARSGSSLDLWRFGGWAVGRRGPYHLLGMHRGFMGFEVQSGRSTVISVCFRSSDAQCIICLDGWVRKVKSKWKFHQKTDIFSCWKYLERDMLYWLKCVHYSRWTFSSEAFTSKVEGQNQENNHKVANNTSV